MTIYLTPEEIASSSRYHFTNEQIHNLLVYRKCNGLEKAVHIVGTKILLNRQKFEKWILTSGVLMDSTSIDHYKTHKLETVPEKLSNHPGEDYLTPDELESDNRFKWAGHEWKKLWGARKYNGLQAAVKEVAGKIFVHLPKVEAWLVETGLGKKFGYPSK